MTFGGEAEPVLRNALDAGPDDDVRGEIEGALAGRRIGEP